MHPALRHVETAICHAESLAEEASSLDAAHLARRLSEASSRLSEELAEAVALLDLIEPARDSRGLAHRSLQSLYNDITCQIEERGCPLTLARLTPGGHLDVVERMRYRVRRLSEADDPELLRMRDQIERALLAYETCVDAYLLTAGEAVMKRDGVIAKSQLLRVTLERAKCHLLTVAPAGSAQWQRIKRRAVRTKRPRWLTREHPEGLLSSERALIARGQVTPSWSDKDAA